MSSVVGMLSRVIEKRVSVYGVQRVDDLLLHLERCHGANEAASREAIRLGCVRGLFLLRTGEGGREEIRRQIVLEEVL